MVTQRTIEDPRWDIILQGQMLLLGDMNAHSPS